jgi:hypothetical protein
MDGRWASKMRMAKLWALQALQALQSNPRIIGASPTSLSLHPKNIYKLESLARA